MFTWLFGPTPEYKCEVIRVESTSRKMCRHFASSGVRIPNSEFILEECKIIIVVIESPDSGKYPVNSKFTKIEKGFTPSLSKDEVFMSDLKGWTRV